jgi:hypothetical protein
LDFCANTDGIIGTRADKFYGIRTGPRPGERCSEAEALIHIGESVHGATQLREVVSLNEFGGLLIHIKSTSLKRHTLTA